MREAADELSVLEVQGFKGNEAAVFLFLYSGSAVDPRVQRGFQKYVGAGGKAQPVCNGS